MPNHGETSNSQQQGHHHTNSTAFWHVYFFVFHVSWIRFTIFFVIPKLVDVIDFWQCCKVVERRRRRNRPLQSTGIPRVACHILVFLELFQRPQDVQHSQANTCGNHYRTNKGNVQVRCPLRMVQTNGIHTTGHAHKAQDVQRYECQPEAPEPAPERGTAQFVVQFVTEHFWPPVSQASHQTEYHTTDNGVMEMGNQEQRVVNHKVSRWNRQQYASHTADGEGNQETHCPQHRHFKANLAFVHGEDPVKDFHTRWNGNNHGHDAEEGIDAWACTHGKEVMHPNHHRQYGNGHGRINHRFVTKQAFAREGRNHF